MIRISNIKLTLEEDTSLLEKKVLKALRITEKEVKHIDIVREAIDARKKHQILKLYHVDVEVQNEEEVLKRIKDPNIKKSEQKYYETPDSGEIPLENPPVIIGTGPAGLMAGYLLAKMGYQPILLERGESVEAREKSIEAFWKYGQLNPASNVQFGEGGAGTFSDGKLTSGIKDLRCKEVLEIFVEHGAPEEILYASKPHIGTDILKKVVKNLRQSIVDMGGTVRFNALVTDIGLKNGQVSHVTINQSEKIPTSIIILAIGHSARDTFEMLYDKGIHMVQKPFAVGVRVEHPQKMMDQIQYGPMSQHPKLRASDYKLTFHGDNQMSAHTFCMCPGGRVVAAASEKETVVTNGMSYYARDLENANSAILVPVDSRLFGSEHVLAGVEFQRKIEAKAFIAGGKDYKAPAQLVGDLIKDRASTQLGAVKPSFEPGVKMTHLKECLPGQIVKTIQQALLGFNEKMNGFAMEEAVLTGVESRSSSPVRIMRDMASLESTSTQGLYPAGEGAGYAGGIMSAGVDGIKIADAIIQKYQSFE